MKQKNFLKFSHATMEAGATKVLTSRVKSTGATKACGNVPCSTAQDFFRKECTFS
jgi:hypothetical protein